MIPDPIATVPGTRGVIRRFFDRLPVSSSTPIVTLDEGDTPLIHSEALSSELNVDVWLKHEGLNPTGSFKDRGMTVAISKALEEGATAVACASTGNTSASAAAYAARAGLPCAVLVPAGFVARGKLAQAFVHGARLLEIDGNFDDALELAKRVADDHPITLVNSVNTYRIEGQKTAAFEIIGSLGRPPDVHVMPVGNAGNIAAYRRGYLESGAAPRIFGFQAAGAAPLVLGHPIENPETIATAIRIGKPASWEQALEAAAGTGGAIGAVSDAEIMTAYRDLAAEGLFVEPASAAGVAGLRRLIATGAVKLGATVVCVLTGHGLKDPETALAEASPPERVGPGEAGVLQALGLRA